MVLAVKWLNRKKTNTNILNLFGVDNKGAFLCAALVVFLVPYIDRNVLIFHISEVTMKSV